MNFLRLGLEINFILVNKGLVFIYFNLTRILLESSNTLKSEIKPSLYKIHKIFKQNLFILQ